MRTLRWRLIIGLLVGITLLFALGATITYLEIRSRLYRDFDRTLLQRAVSLASRVKEEKGRFDLGRLGRSGEVPGYEPGVDYYYLSAKLGEALVMSKDWTNAAMHTVTVPTDEPQFLSIALPGDVLGRAVTMETRVEVDLGKKAKAAVLRGEASSPAGPKLRVLFARPDTVATMLRDIHFHSGLHRHSTP